MTVPTPAPTAGPEVPVVTGTDPAAGQVPASGGSVIPPGASVAGSAGEAAQAAAAAAGQVASGQVDLGTLPPAVQTYIEELRRQAATTRTSNRDTPAQLAAVAKAKEDAAEAERLRVGRALGFIPDENATPPSLESLTAQFEQERAALRTQVRDLTVSQAIDRLLVGTHPFAKAAMKGDGVFEKLDPDAPDFVEQATAAVAGYLDTYPALKATTTPIAAPPVGTSGVDLSGNAGAPGGRRSVEEIREARRKPATRT